jgi:hypothetical protein
MDPITTAIVVAITAGLAGGATEVGKQTIVDAYQALKSLLEKKFGAQSEIVHAVEDLEAKPDSTARKDLLYEEVTEAKADQDPEIRQAAQVLLAQISAQQSGGQSIQNAIGSYIAQADRGSTAHVNVNKPKE